MNHILKSCLYYGASRIGELPFFRAHFAARAVIILFHEIQPDYRSELMTGTSVSLFERSLDWLRHEGWSIVSLDECLRRLSSNDRSHRCAVLTFDDGYRDNVSVALPILERHNAPFTVYVPTGALTRSMQSWWLVVKPARIPRVPRCGRGPHRRRWSARPLTRRRLRGVRRAGRGAAPPSGHNARVHPDRRADS